MRTFLTAVTGLLFFAAATSQARAADAYRDDNARVLLVPAEPRTEATAWVIVGDPFRSESACRAHQRKMLDWIARRSKGLLAHRIVELGRCVPPQDVDSYRTADGIRHVR